MGDGSQQPSFQLEFSSGRGLLDARALWASVVGPQRLAMAQTRVVQLRADRPVEIYKAMGSAEAYVFVGVALPAGGPVATLGVMFSRGSEIGSNSAAPAILIPSMVGGNHFSQGFTQLLQPDEQLYGQINDPAFPPNNSSTTRVVVAAVVF